MDSTTIDKIPISSINDYLNMISGCENISNKTKEKCNNIKILLYNIKRSITLDNSFKWNDNHTFEFLIIYCYEEKKILGLWKGGIWVEKHAKKYNNILQWIYKVRKLVHKLFMSGRLHFHYE